MRLWITGWCLLCCSLAMAKPTMHAKQLSSSAKYTEKELYNTIIYHADGRTEQFETAEVIGRIKEFNSSQKYQISISVANDEDLKEDWYLNIITIVRSRAKNGYGYSDKTSFKLNFSRSGANEGSLKLTYITPQLNPADGWVVNGVAIELLDKDNNVMRTWSNSSFNLKFASGIDAFVKNLPRTVKPTPIQVREIGVIGKKSEFVTVEVVKQEIKKPKESQRE